MVRTLEIPFPPGHQPSAGSRLKPPFVPIELRWEYREIVSEDSALLAEADLNSMGEEGWELVGLAPTGNRVHFYFKRERHP
jgi:hypothetical protein